MRRRSRKNKVRWPVSRVLSRHARGHAMDDHSSGTSVTGRLLRPTRTAPRDRDCRRTGCCPYLVLLPVGFAVPRPLPAARCALTAPFHPYLRARRRAGGLLSVALSLGSPPPGVTRHRDPVEPGLSSLRLQATEARPSSHLTCLPVRRWPMRGQPTRPATAAARPAVSASIRPSNRDGRKRRWKAATAALPSAVR